MKDGHAQSKMRERFEIGTLAALLLVGSQDLRTRITQFSAGAPFMLQDLDVKGKKRVLSDICYLFKTEDSTSYALCEEDRHYIIGTDSVRYIIPPRGKQVSRAVQSTLSYISPAL